MSFGSGYSILTKVTLWRGVFFSRFFLFTWKLYQDSRQTTRYPQYIEGWGSCSQYPVPSWKIPILSSQKTRITIHKSQLIITNRTCLLLADIDWHERWGRWPKIRGNTLLSQFTGKSFHTSRRTGNCSFPVHREYIFVIPVHRKFRMSIPRIVELLIPSSQKI